MSGSNAASGICTAARIARDEASTLLSALIAAESNPSTASASTKQ